MSKKKLYIIIDDDINIKAQMLDYKYIGNEVFCEMDKLKEQYEMTPEELQNMYRLDESLKNDLEIHNYKYQCKVILSIEDTDTESLDKARSILDTISFQRMKPKTS